MTQGFRICVRLVGGTWAAATLAMFLLLIQSIAAASPRRAPSEVDPRSISNAVTQALVDHNVLSLVMEGIHETAEGMRSGELRLDRVHALNVRGGPAWWTLEPGRPDTANLRVWLASPTDWVDASPMGRVVAPDMTADMRKLTRDWNPPRSLDAELRLLAPDINGGRTTQGWLDLRFRFFDFGSTPAARMSVDLGPNVGLWSSDLARLWPGRLQQRFASARQPEMMQTSPSDVGFVLPHTPLLMVPTTLERLKPLEVDLRRPPKDPKLKQLAEALNELLRRPDFVDWLNEIAKPDPLQRASNGHFRAGEVSVSFEAENDSIFLRYPGGETRWPNFPSRIETAPNLTFDFRELGPNNTILIPASELLRVLEGKGGVARVRGQFQAEDQVEHRLPAEGQISWYERQPTFGKVALDRLLVEVHSTADRRSFPSGAVRGDELPYLATASLRDPGRAWSKREMVEILEHNVDTTLALLDQLGLSADKIIANGLDQVLRDAAFDDYERIQRRLLQIDQDVRDGVDAPQRLGEREEVQRVIADFRRVAARIQRLALRAREQLGILEHHQAAWETLVERYAEARERLKTLPLEPDDPIPDDISPEDKELWLLSGSPEDRLRGRIEGTEWIPGWSSLVDGHKTAHNRLEVYRKPAQVIQAGLDEFLQHLSDQLELADELSRHFPQN